MDGRGLLTLLVKTKKYGTISYRCNKTPSFFVNVVKGARKMWIFLQTMIDTPPVKRPIDEGWIKQIADGDMQALHRLYDAIHRNVYAFAYSLVQNKPDAEDILQETFLRIHTYAPAYRPQGKPLAWIFTIARHLAQDKLRRRHYHRSMDAGHPVIADVSHIEKAEHRILLHALLNVLTEEDRQIVVLHTAVGMKYRDIAEVMDMPLNTVLSRHHRAMKKLKSIAEEECK